MQDLKDSVKKLLKLFYGIIKKKPQRIIFMRDGVSEGQFPQVWMPFQPWHHHTFLRGLRHPLVRTACATVEQALATCVCLGCEGRMQSAKSSMWTLQPRF